MGGVVVFGDKVFSVLLLVEKGGIVKRSAPIGDGKPETRTVGADALAREAKSKCFTI